MQGTRCRLVVTDAFVYSTDSHCARHVRQGWVLSNRTSLATQLVTLALVHIGNAAPLHMHKNSDRFVRGPRYYGAAEAQQGYKG